MYSLLIKCMSFEVICYQLWSCPSQLKQVRAVLFKSVGGGGTEGFLKGDYLGPNHEFIYPIRLHMISGKRGGGGGGCRILNYLPFLPHDTFK